MANKPLNMHKIKQILLFLDRGYSQRSIEKETGINRRTIASYQQRFSESKLSYSELLIFSDEELEVYVNADRAPQVQKDPRRTELESRFPYLLSELNKVGVTRLLLWQEYIQEYPEGFLYSRFCELLQDHITTKGASMRFEYEPGKLFQVDFAGDMLHYVDVQTGEVMACPVFVAVLPFSGYGYVEALPDASLPNVVKALNNTLSYFGGVPLSVKSDNMRQWVSRINRYEPKFTDMLEQWANHNGIALLATRPRKPKDKAPVENSVKIAYQRIYAPIRKETFTSLPQLNQAILKQLEEHHRKNFQRKTFSRRELFENQERQTLQPLPTLPFFQKHYTRGKVQRNYHIVVGEDWHFYSVPSQYISKEVRIVYCTDTVEIYHNNKRIAIHKRSYKKHGYTTLRDHLPENHQHMRDRLAWNPDVYLSKADKYGTCTREYFQKVMDSKLIIDQAYTACQGLLRLAAAYPDRIEMACARALKGQRFNYTAIKNILDNKMDILEQQEPPKQYTIPLHDNIRGPEEYK